MYGYSTDPGPLSYDDWFNQDSVQQGISDAQPHKKKKHGLFHSITHPSLKNVKKQFIDPAGALLNQATKGRYKTVDGTPFDPQAEYQNYLSQYNTEHPKQAPLTAADYSGFFESPDYQFRKTQGMQGIERSAAARGGAFSGNALRALNEFNSNLAAGEFGNWFNRQSTLAGLGNAATTATASVGADTAGQIARNDLYAGSSRASGINARAGAFGDTLNSLAGSYGYYRARQV